MAAASDPRPEVRHLTPTLVSIGCGCWGSSSRQGACSPARSDPGSRLATAPNRSPASLPSASCTRLATRPTCSAARLFSWLFPIGNIAFRVDLFSAVCATVTVGAVFALARRFAVSRPAGAVAALTLASGASTLYYAGYAKHYALSGTLVVLSTLFVVRWVQDRPGGTSQLVVAGGLIGAMAGASWQLALLTVPALGILVLLGGRRTWTRPTGWAVGAGAAVAVALYGFVFVRAHQDPAVNWGDASSLTRLERLVTMADFGLSGRVGSGTLSGRPGSSMIVRLERYVHVLQFDLSLLALVVASIGLVAAWRQRSQRLAAAYSATAIVVNIAAAAVIVSPGRVTSSSSALVLGGFLLGALVGLAIAVGLGIDWLMDGVHRLMPVSRRPALRYLLALALGLVLVGPAVWSHYSEVGRRQNHFAEQYASNLFASVPQNAVLVVWSAERTFPLLERQVVHGERPDVDVIAGDGLAYESYRSQIERQLHVELPASVHDPYLDAVSAVTALEARGPVVLDLYAGSRCTTSSGTRYGAWWRSRSRGGRCPCPRRSRADREGVAVVQPRRRLHRSLPHCLAEQAGERRLPPVAPRVGADLRGASPLGRRRAESPRCSADRPRRRVGPAEPRGPLTTPNRLTPVDRRADGQYMRREGCSRSWAWRGAVRRASTPRMAAAAARQLSGSAPVT